MARNFYSGRFRRGILASLLHFGISAVWLWNDSGRFIDGFLFFDCAFEWTPFTNSAGDRKSRLGNNGRSILGRPLYIFWQRSLDLARQYRVLHAEPHLAASALRFFGFA